MPRQNGLKGSPHTTNKAWRDGYDQVFGKKKDSAEQLTQIEKVLAIDVSGKRTTKCK